MSNGSTTRLAILVVAGMILAGCQTTNQQRGKVIGAIAGGLIGNEIGSGTGRVIATIAGSMVGGYLGGQIGREMDESDRARTDRALSDTPTSATSGWENPDTGKRYAVTPTRSYTTEQGPCREYTTEAWIDGNKETVFGTACREPDGSWQAHN